MKNPKPEINQNAHLRFCIHSTIGKGKTVEKIIHNCDNVKKGSASLKLGKAGQK